MKNKIYLIAVKGAKENEVQEDWVDQIRDFSGIELQESTPDQVTVSASEQAIKRLARMLGNDFLIEEEVTRY